MGYSKSIMDGVGLWCGYYRKNPHRFVKDFFHLELHLFQKILLVMMNISVNFVFIASRGLGKTFLSAVFCCQRCILYPGTKICIASGTRGQSINVLEKINTELKVRSPELCNEINVKETRINGTNAQIVFKNGSFIKVVTASDTARGNLREALHKFSLLHIIALMVGDSHKASCEKLGRLSYHIDNMLIRVEGCA